MTTLTYGQRSWMATHIANGLRTLGLAVTPQSIDGELERVSALRATSSASDYAPPDPYAAGLAAQRDRDAKAAAARTYQPQPPRPTHHPTGHAPPDPYAAPLERLRKEHR